jgi:general secretion pathway protein M
VTLRDRLDALAPREKRLLMLLAGVFGVLILAAIPFGVSALLSEAEATHGELVEAISRIETEGEAVRERQAERDALLARYDTPVPALAGYLDKAAQASGITIPESKDPSPVAHGKKFEERFTSISLRKVNLLPLVKFMERVSGGPEPISISKLNIRKRGGEADSYDVQMTVSAFHRIAPKETAPKDTGGKAKPTATSKAEEAKDDELEEDLK